MAEMIIEQRGYYYPERFVMRVINGIVGLIELALFIRLVLEMLAANPSTEFVAWFYATTYPLVAPFAGAFPTISMGGQLVIDLSVIFAMVVYAVIGWLIEQVLLFIFFPAHRP